MKLKAIKLGVLTILISFVVSIGANAFACLSPFTMNLEKSIMKCEDSAPPAALLADQSDKNCKDSLFKDGHIHHVKSSFQVFIFKDFNMVSTSFMTSTVNPAEEPSVLGFSLEDRLPHLKYSTTPLYTFHHSFLI